jgi:hypothetical protein
LAGNLKRRQRRLSQGVLAQVNAGQNATNRQSVRTLSFQDEMVYIRTALRFGNSTKFYFIFNLKNLELYQNTLNEH